MIRIANTNIHLGTAADLRDIRSVLNAGVTAIIDLAIEEPLPTIPRVTNYCRFVITDDGENDPGIIQTAIQTAFGFLSNGQTIAICCNAGLNRSPAIAAAVVSKINQCEPADALKLVGKTKHIDVNPALWRQIVSLI